MNAKMRESTGNGDKDGIGGDVGNGGNGVKGGNVGNGGNGGVGVVRRMTQYMWLTS